MKKTDSVILRQKQIQDRIASGLKVNDWCEQNDISRATYYYWHRRLKDIQETKKDVFAKVPLPVQLSRKGPVRSAEVVIS